ncbi:MAG: DUF3822 family protein [Prevotellaceae bacterium]|jgi:hypothetical protein|nr:DUF3822 family protein [Prevotellaceae bacterium]
MQSGIDYVDKSYCLTENKNYRLSIQVSLNGFSFCMYDPVKQKHVVLKHFVYSENIADCDIWTKEINRIADLMTDNLAPVASPVKCLFTSRKNTLIPKSVFSENNIKSYLSFFFQLDELDEIHYKYISEIEAYCCYALPSPVVAGIISRFGRTEFYNQAYTVIRRINNCKTGMNIVFCNNFMDVSVFRDNKLVLNNSFEIFDLKDIIYFVSAISDKFNVKDIPIYISGNISNSEIKKLKKFFPLIVQEQNGKISLALGSEVSTKYYNLLSLHECE